MVDAMMLTCHSIKLAPALPSLFKRLKAVFNNAKLNVLLEVDNQQMTALPIICAKPHVTGDVICTFYNWLQEQMHKLLAE